MTELERHKKAVAVLTEALKQYAHPDSTSVCDVLAHIGDILKPPPAMEDVEVVRYFVPSQPNSSAIFNDLDLAQRCCVRNEEPVPLKGIWKRRAPRLSEKSVSVKASVSFNGFVVEGKGGAFADHPEVKDKSGILTFTWLEPV